MKFQKFLLITICCLFILLLFPENKQDHFARSGGEVSISWGIYKIRSDQNPLKIGEPPACAPLNELLIIKFKQMSVLNKLKNLKFDPNKPSSCKTLARIRKDQERLTRFTLDLSQALKEDAEAECILKEAAFEMFAVCKLLDKQIIDQTTYSKIQKSVDLLNIVIKRAGKKTGAPQNSLVL